MEAALMLTVVCAVVLLVGWLYAAAIHAFRRRRAKSEENTIKNPLSLPAQRP